MGTNLCWAKEMTADVNLKPQEQIREPEVVN